MHVFSASGQSVNVKIFEEFYADVGNDNELTKNRIDLIKLQRSEIIHTCLLSEKYPVKNLLVK